jgi:Flp pilus assembly protein TadD
LRARIALDRGDLRAAEAIVAEGPTNHADLARLRGRLALARHDGPAALRHFRAAYDADPDNRDLLLGLANALMMVGNEAEAAAYFKVMRDHDTLGALLQRVPTPGASNDPKLFDQLGAACEAIHRLREARAWYNLAIERDPFQAEAQQALSRLDAAIAAADKLH